MSRPQPPLSALILDGRTGEPRPDGHPILARLAAGDAGVGCPGAVGESRCTRAGRADPGIARPTSNSPPPQGTASRRLGCGSSSRLSLPRGTRRPLGSESSNEAAANWRRRSLRASAANRLVDAAHRLPELMQPAAAVRVALSGPAPRVTSTRRLLVTAPEPQGQLGECAGAQERGCDPAPTSRTTGARSRPRWRCREDRR